MNRSQLVLSFLGVVIVALGTSCSSAKKERLEQREKMSASSGLYCDFVNGEKYTDVEVVMNLEMAKRCDSSKSFSISHYKSPAEVIGMMYCCSLPRKADIARVSPAPLRSVAPHRSTAPAVVPAPVNNNKPAANTPSGGASATNPVTMPNTVTTPSSITTPPPTNNNLVNPANDDIDEVISE